MPQLQLSKKQYLGTRLPDEPKYIECSLNKCDVSKPLMAKLVQEEYPHDTISYIETRGASVVFKIESPLPARN